MNLQKLIVMTVVILLSPNTLAQSSQNNKELVNILCPNKVDKRQLTFDRNSGLWCDVTIENYCERIQLQAAHNVCSKAYKLKLSRIGLDAEPASTVATNSNDDISKTERIAKLERERMEIERQRLDIAQRRLEIRKREMELMKQIQ